MMDWSMWASEDGFHGDAVVAAVVVGVAWLAYEATKAASTNGEAMGLANADTAATMHKFAPLRSNALRVTQPGQRSLGVGATLFAEPARSGGWRHRRSPFGNQRRRRSRHGLAPLQAYEGLPRELEDKLDEKIVEHESIETRLSDPETVKDAKLFKTLCKGMAQLKPIVDEYGLFKESYSNAMGLREELSSPAVDEDAEWKALLIDEVEALESSLAEAEERLVTLMIPKDPDDARNVMLEVRSGAGGDEAAIFAGDVFRMYQRYAERRGWKASVISYSESPMGGCREATLSITGEDIYGNLKFESGTHRVQRVPATESQGRVHTSTCTVAVLPEADETDDDVEINQQDLRIDVFRASGAGGQHINKTESAVRITHIPTGVVVECQDGRSQTQNKLSAMRVLRARLLAAQVQAKQEEEAAARRSLVGTGDRSERIRTYNFPQGRVTDHRISLTVQNLTDVLDGGLDGFTTALQTAQQAEAMAVS